MQKPSLNYDIEGSIPKRSGKSFYPTFLLTITILVLFPWPTYSQTEKSMPTTRELKTMSMEELMEIEVTSVSKRPEKLSEVASSIQVLTGEEILKYGATNIPEALYLAGNLQVAQKGSHSWGISARGFNTDLANKMLVLMDGRTLYTPLFSGVFWDRQDYLLEDINQIEIISGPGGTLWGANAVNGVINISTKKADETQGLFVEGAAGNKLRTLGGIRYGGKITPDIYYRVYAKYGSRDGAVFPDSTDAHDSWTMTQGGFRIDAKISSGSRFTFHGDAYKNRADLISGETSDVTGQNVMARWSYTFSDSSQMRLQTYYDHTDLGLPTAPFVVNDTELAPEGTFKDKLSTFDIELEHRFTIGHYNSVVWGLGYRFMHDDVTNSPALGFIPDMLNLDLFNVFIQDDISLAKHLFLTLGTKLEHNDYTGFEWEPNGRIRWKFREDQIVWAAVSRAVRTPSRVDRHISQASPPFFVLLTGNPNFKSETVTAIESGFRSLIGTSLTTTVSLFYNKYDRIRSTILDPVTIFPLIFENGLAGETYGFELSFTYQPTNWWQLFTSYNLLKEDIRVKNGQTDFNNTYNETADPGWQFLLRSSVELPWSVSIQAAFRWIDELPINNAGKLATVPSYAELDGNITWQMTDKIELSVAGRNLLHEYHVEYGVPGPELVGIERSVFGKITWQIWN